jgi:hypothetical protein
MPELKKTNQAHVSAFMFLRINGQSARPFASQGAGEPGMGLQRMRDLAFFNSAASQDLLKTSAALIAHMLAVFVTSYYTQQREKDYENLTTEELVAELVSLMIQPDKTVHDLAEKIDRMWRFASEASAAVPLAALAAEVKVPPATKKKLKKMGIK